MKKTLFTALLLASATMAGAQQANDPVIMTVNGVDVPRSEFEYSYNKNNTDGVIDKIRYNQGWTIESDITIEQSRPLPMNILVIAPIVNEVDK